MKPSRLEIVIGIILFIFISLFCFKAEAKMSGECWVGGKISEQTSVGCAYLKNKRYVGLYGFRHVKRINHTTKSVFRPMSKRRIK